MPRLQTSGDQFEKDYWPLFIKDQFPSYETFWLKSVLPLRKGGINSFFNDPEPMPGEIELNIHIAQLNYGVIRHLIRCFEILKSLKEAKGFDQYDLFVEGITRLIGAIDNGDELLARRMWPQKYVNKLTEKIRNEADNARSEWRAKMGDPLKEIRYYRNRIIHGSPLSAIINNDENRSICLPEAGKENLYLDFRLITSSPLKLEEYKKDFIPVLRILESIWHNTIKYLEGNWKNL